MHSLKGYRCFTCGALGEHLERECPHAAKVGMPEAFRKEYDARAVLAAYKDPPFPPGYVPSGTLVPLLRARADVPRALACRVCGLLVDRPVWCAACDGASCSGCLAPDPAEPWVCPCGNRNQCGMHLVGPLADLAQHWLQLVATWVDNRYYRGETVAAGAPPEPPKRGHTAGAAAGVPPPPAPAVVVVLNPRAQTRKTGARSK